MTDESGRVMEAVGRLTGPPEALYNVRTLRQWARP
jgi:hypothetical protein